MHNVRIKIFSGLASPNKLDFDERTGDIRIGRASDVEMRLRPGHAAVTCGVHAHLARDEVGGWQLECLHASGVGVIGAGGAPAPFTPRDVIGKARSSSKRVKVLAVVGLIAVIGVTIGIVAVNRSSAEQIAGARMSAQNDDRRLILNIPDRMHPAYASWARSTGQLTHQLRVASGDLGEPLPQVGAGGARESTTREMVVGHTGYPVVAPDPVAEPTDVDILVVASSSLRGDACNVIFHAAWVSIRQ